jgi:hypothetical protein
MEKTHHHKRRGMFWGISIVAFLVGFALLVFTNTLGHAQKRGFFLSVSLNMPESGSVPESQDPSHVITLEKAQQVLIAIAQEPREIPFIEEALDGTGITLDDLLATRLVNRRDGLCTIGFSLFTVEDQRRLRETCNDFAEDLARVYLSRRAKFEDALRHYPMKQIDISTLAYVLLGCFSLDWDGLRITRELGYRPSSPPKNAAFTGWADDRRAKEFKNKKGLYWGSHNEYLENGVAFTTFGDHASIQRNGFPDLAWQMARRLRLIRAPEEVKPALVAAGRRAIYSSMLGQAADIMMALRKGNKSLEELRKATDIDSGQTKDLLAILKGLDYIKEVSGRYEAMIPVFAPEDQQMIQNILLPSGEMMASWLKQNYSRLEAQLANLSAYKYGQPLEATFYKVWHELFGAANRILVETGMFSDPYRESKKFKGFVPVVWHMQVRGTR